MSPANYKLPVATYKGTHFFNLDDIIRLESSSNYTAIFTVHNKKILASKVLKEFAALLVPLGFVRTHRSHLINKRHIKSIEPSGLIIMNDASVAEISRRKKKAVVGILLNAA